MTEIISSTTNPVIKLARSLRSKKNRDESKLFLVEGLLHVGEAFEANWLFECLIYCPEKLKSDFGYQLINRGIKKDIRCVQVPAQVMISISEKENPQGIIAIVRQRSLSLENVNDFTLMTGIVSPQDPGNFGTILRTMDAVKGNGVILIDGGVDPYHPSAVRASMGTIFWQPFYSVNFTEFQNWAKKRNSRIIGTSAHGSVNYHSITYDGKPVILLLGSEQKGLTPEQVEVCDELVFLPMLGKVTSLNISVAAGIFLYEINSHLN